MRNSASSWTTRFGGGLALSAILLAIIGGRIIEQVRIDLSHRPDAPPLLGWLLLGAAGLLLGVAAPPPPKLAPSAVALLRTGFRTIKRKSLFLGPLVGAAVCAVTAVPLFWKLNALTTPQGAAEDWLVNTGPWVLYVVALFLFAVAFTVWERTTPPSPVRDWPTCSPPGDRGARRTDWAWMGTLFFLALLLRLPRLDTIPPGLWFDEAYHGYIAMGLVGPHGTHRTFIPDVVHFGALYFYVLGWVLELTGNVIWALRLLPALAGALIAPLLYLLAARLYGWRAGVAAGGLLAVSAWNLTFSRLGMVGMFTAAFDLAVLLCVVQALRTGRLGYYAGGGIMMGLALQTYYTARLVPVVLSLIGAHLLVTEGVRLVRALRAGVLVFAMGTLLAFLPVFTFAVQRPDDFNSRLTTVSVFSPQNSRGDPIGALGRNVRSHLLMFNWQGDANGRHNLPGSPMLDWLGAAIFFAGLGSCLWRAWRWQYAFPLLWFAVTLAAGVLSMPSEAPQSHRTLENSITTALLAGIFLAEAWALLADGPVTWCLARLLARREPSRSPVVAARLASALGVAGMLLCVGWAGLMEVHKYFKVQAKSAAVWSMMDGDKLYAAQTVLRYAADKDYDVYVTPAIKSTHAFQFLTPNLLSRDWPGMYTVPLSTSRRAGVVIVLDAPSGADVAALARIYPHATFDVAGQPDQAPLLYVVRVPASDVEQLRGVHAAVYDPGSRQPTSQRTIPSFSYDWSGVEASPHVVRLSTTLKVEQYAVYTFAVNSGPGAHRSAALLVDGDDVTAGQPVTLAAGLHSVVLTDTVRSAAGTFSVSWSRAGGPPGPLPDSNLFDPQKIEPHGLTGLYRPAADPGTAPATARVDPVISFAFHTIALPRPYNVEWRGRLRVPQEGSYTLATAQRTASELFLDGEAIIENSEANTIRDRQLQLSAGWHDLRLLFRDQENYSYVSLFWTPPGRARSIIPSAFLWPVLGQYPSDVPSLSLEDADGTQLPLERVTYVPSRDGTLQALPQPEAKRHEELQPPTRIAEHALATGSSAGGAKPPALPAPITSIQPLFLLGENGTLPAEPRAAAGDANGNIYVSTEGDSKIHKYTAAGKEVASWDVRDAAGNPYPDAPPLAIQGNQLFVMESVSAIDHTHADLISYTLDGLPLGRVVACRCHFARGLAASRDGNFWLADTGYGMVSKVSPAGTQLQILGREGDAPGQFREPASVWEAPDGTVFVADIGNQRAQSFNPDLTPRAQWPIDRSIARDGNRLTGDHAGNVLVTQTADRAVVLYDRDGRELRRWCYRKDGEALAPSGITSLGGDRFLVLFPKSRVGAVFTTVAP